MSLWKEIRCDASPESSDCYSRRNAGPKGFGAVQHLEAEARRAGWKVTSGKATCPACLKEVQ